MMQHIRAGALLIAVVCGCLAATACSGGGGASTAGTPTTGTPTSTAKTTPTAQPTPTAKPKPTSPPAVTMAFCQSIMTVADANQIMQPPTPVTTIQAQSDAELGVCSYLSPQTQLAVVKILVEEKPYTGPTPVPTSTIIQLATELANEPGVTITSTTPVTGVGDQAEFLAASVTAQSLTLYADAIYVIYGHVAFMCDDFHLNTKPDDAAQKTALQQCAARVVSQL